MCNTLLLLLPKHVCAPYILGHSGKYLYSILVSQVFINHNKALMKRDFDLLGYFKNPPSQRQKQYDAVRAIVIEKQSVEMVAKKYNYKHSTIFALLRDAKAGKIELFPIVQKGPQQKRTPSEVQEKIIAYRKQRLSTPDIQSLLSQENIHLSVTRLLLTTDLATQFVSLLLAADIFAKLHKTSRLYLVGYSVIPLALLSSASAIKLFF